MLLSQIHPYIKRHNKHAHKQGDMVYTGVYRDNTHAHTENVIRKQKEIIRPHEKFQIKAIKFYS